MVKIIKTEKIRGLVLRNWPYIFFCAITFLFFLDFFIKGHVLAGNSDRLEALIPNHILIQKAVKSLVFPHWNPYIFCGNPFTLFNSSVFYPPMLIAYLGPESGLLASMTFSLAAHVFLALGAAFLFFKKLFNSILWAVSSSVVYVFSSSSVLNMSMGVEHYSVFTFFPLMLYLVHVREERPKMMNFVYQTITVSLLVLSCPNVQIVLYFIGFYLSFSLYTSAVKCIQSRKFSCGGILVSFLSVVISFFVNAVKLIPFYLVSKEAGGSTVSYSKLLEYSRTSISDTLRFFSHEFFGSGVTESFTGSLNYFESFSCYVSIGAAILGLFAFFFIWNKKTFFWKIMIIIILLIVLTPVSYLHYLFFMRSFLMFNKLVWFLPICFAALSGYAGMSVFDSKKQCLRVIKFSMILLGSVLLFFAGVYLNLPAEIRSSHGDIMLRSFLHFFVAFIISLSVLLLFYKTRERRKIYVIIFILFVFVDIFLVAITTANNRPFLLSVEDIMYRRIPDSFLDRVNADDGHRFLMVGQNTNAVLGLYNIAGYDSMISDHLADLFSHPVKKDRVSNRKAYPTNLRIIRLCSADSIVDRGRYADISPALSMVKLFYKYQVIPDDNEKMKKLHSPEFDFFETIVLDESPNISIKSGGGTGKVDILEQGFNAVKIGVMSSDNAMLLLNDTYFAGWKAYDNGVQAKIYRANHAFKAVEITRGTHVVEFIFMPQGFKTGAYISSITLFFLVMFMIFSRRFSREKNYS